MQVKETKTVFCFFKQDGRKQPQQNNMPDKTAITSTEERRGDQLNKGDGL